MKRAALCLGLASLAVAVQGADKSSYRVEGVFTETCACRIPCTCELTGDVPSYCQGVGAMSFTAGNFAGSDLAGVKLAYAVKPGEWVRLYIQAPDQARRDTAEKFARVAFKDWGAIEAVKDSRIDIKGSNGAYTVKVDEGKIMTYVIEPVLVGDGKTALTHGNTHNVFTRTFAQAKSVNGLEYQDGERTIKLAAGRNGYFHDRMESSGEL